MKKVLFRSSVTGYNKKDVNEYIASTDARHAEELARAERRVSELEAELESAKNVYEMKISGLEASSRQAEREAMDSAKKLSEAKESSLRALTNAQSETAAARQRSEELKKRLADAEARIARQSYEVKKLLELRGSTEAAIPDAAELADLRRRAAAYDELEKKRLTQPQTGIEAEAENVIQSARTEAASIRREALRDNAEALEEAKKQISAELTEIYSMIRRAAAESMEEMLSCMRSAEDEIGKLGDQLNDKSRSAAARAESVCSEIEKIIEKKLDEAGVHADAEKTEAARADEVRAKRETKVEKAAALNHDAPEERPEPYRTERHGRSSAGRRTSSGSLFGFGRKK